MGLRATAEFGPSPQKEISLALAIQEKDDRVRESLGTGQGSTIICSMKKWRRAAGRGHPSRKFAAHFPRSNTTAVARRRCRCAAAAHGVLAIRRNRRRKPHASWKEARGEKARISTRRRTLDKTNDPVRLYLREMGSVPLLKREGEVALAKRMERGHGLVLKTISRSPIILRSSLQLAGSCATGRARSRRSCSSTKKS